MNKLPLPMTQDVGGCNIRIILIARDALRGRAKQESGRLDPLKSLGGTYCKY